MSSPCVVLRSPIATLDSFSHRDMLSKDTKLSCRKRPLSSTSPSPPRKHAGDEGTGSKQDEHQDDNDSIAKMKAAEEALEAKKKKEQPSFELSGKLAAETNRVRGVTLIYSEPIEARIPDLEWRLYVFKAGEMGNEPLYIHRQSCYLFGRERRVADIPTDHPSCSKQHAVIQFRQIELLKEDTDGIFLNKGTKVKPYLIDLGSTNGTLLDGKRIDAERYYELFEKVR